MLSPPLVPKILYLEKLTDKMKMTAFIKYETNKRVLKDASEGRRHYSSLFLKKNIRSRDIELTTYTPPGSAKIMPKVLHKTFFGSGNPRSDKQLTIYSRSTALACDALQQAYKKDTHSFSIKQTCTAEIQKYNDRLCHNFTRTVLRYPFLLYSMPSFLERFLKKTPLTQPKNVSTDPAAMAELVSYKMRLIRNLRKKFNLDDDAIDILNHLFAPLSKKQASRARRELREKFTDILDYIDKHRPLSIENPEGLSLEAVVDATRFEIDGDFKLFNLFSAKFLQDYPVLGNRTHDQLWTQINADYYTAKGDVLLSIYYSTKCYFDFLCCYLSPIKNDIWFCITEYGLTVLEYGLYTIIAIVFCGFGYLKWDVERKQERKEKEQKHKEQEQKRKGRQ